jgi:retron-type reverse transcriptase
VYREPVRAYHSASVVNKRKSRQNQAQFFDDHGSKNIYQLLTIDKTKVVDIITNIENHYRSYPIKKSSGALRWIDAPQDELKIVQKKILNRLLYQFRAHESAVGFIKHISVKDGAEKHLGNKVVLCMDVQNFFGSFSLFQVYAAFGYMLRKFTDTKKSFSYDSEDLDILVKLTTYKACVPQGAPTSPALANIICRQMDRELKAIADKNDLVYTRYADDLAFSHARKNFKITKVIEQTKKILSYYGLKLNKKKTRVLRPHKRMCITGVVINEKLSVPKYVWRNVRAQLHNLSKKGESLTLDDYQKLRGKIEWIGLFRPQLKTSFLEKLGKVTLAT